MKAFDDVLIIDNQRATPRTLASIAMVLSLCISHHALAAGHPAHGAPGGGTHFNHNPMVVLDSNALEPGLAKILTSSALPVVVQFYDSNDQSAECVNSEAAFNAEIAKYAGTAVLVRADVNKQLDANALAQARINVCPTTLFVITKQNGTLDAHRITGLMNEEDIEETMDEFYHIKPQP